MTRMRGGKKLGTRAQARSAMLDIPLTNRAFLLGCAHVGQMLYDLTCAIKESDDYTDSIGDEFHRCLKNTLAGDLDEDMNDFYKLIKLARRGYE
jgi:hypothetical protein